MGTFVNHEACPSCREQGKDRQGNNLGVYSDGGAYCFSCGFTRRATHYSPIIKERKQHDPLLPADYTREIPPQVWTWLLQFGLPPGYWEEQVGYSANHQRLIFSVGESPQAVSFYTGRYTGEIDDRPTSSSGSLSSSRKPAKWHHYGNPHLRPTLYGNPFEAKECVLVEDLISAHKIAFSPHGGSKSQEARVVAPLFGTRVVDEFIPVLRHLQMPVCMWLDKDQEQHAAKRAKRLSILLQQPVRYVFTEADPKSLSFSRIQEVLDKH